NVTGLSTMYSPRRLIVLTSGASAATGTATVTPSTPTAGRIIATPSVTLTTSPVRSTQPRDPSLISASLSTATPSGGGGNKCSTTQVARRTATDVSATFFASGARPAGTGGTGISTAAWASNFTNSGGRAVVDGVSARSPTATAPNRANAASAA